MKKTIGFNNKKNIWTSKYDYVSSNYTSIDKKFFSSRDRVAPSDDVVAWEHNKSGTNNNFYGTQYDSAIHVSFNDNPSQNKIYKTFSIEGTENLAGSINTFTTSEFLQPDITRQAIEIGTLTNKGGILFGHMGRDQRLKANVNLKYAGSFIAPQTLSLAIEPIAGDLWKINGVFGNSVVSSSSPTYVLFSFESDPNNLVSIGTQASISYVPLGSSYYNIDSGITVATDQYVETVLGTSTPEDGLVIRAGSSQMTRLNELCASPSNFNRSCNVFVATDPKINGDFLRGQYAEAAINLGNGNFELYALNVNYEPTDLDHSK